MARGRFYRSPSEARGESLRSGWILAGCCTETEWQSPCYTGGVRLQILFLFLFTGLLQAQSAAPAVADPLGRTSPQSSIYQFLEACHARDYSKASYYLDLRQMNPAIRAKK